ncbi:MAG: HEAT repeat domain-containing protein, partial [Planctomycetia bacterium]|nr:HEAT repeat domain-containing protein [Planctomycetia bacterium]
MLSRGLRLLSGAALVICMATSARAGAISVLEDTATKAVGKKMHMQAVACPRVKEAITLDGRLSEKSWKVAGKIVLQLGVRAATTQNARPGMINDKTEVLFLYDDKNLYIGVICHESTPDMIKIIEGGNSWQTWLQDSVELYIDPQRDKTTYYHLMFSAGNGRMSEKGDYKKKLSSPLTDIKWRWKTRIDAGAKAWYAEVAIPLDQLGIEGKKGVSFGFNVERKDLASVGGVSEPRSFWTDPKFVPGFPPHANPAYYGIVSLEAPCMVGAVGLSGKGLYGADKVFFECGNYSSEATTALFEATLVVVTQKGKEKTEKVVWKTSRKALLKPRTKYKPSLKLDIPTEGKYLLKVRVSDTATGTELFREAYRLHARYNMDFPDALAKAGKVDELIKLFTAKKHPKLERDLIWALGRTKHAKVVPVLLEQLKEPRSDKIDPMSTDPDRHPWQDWKGEKRGYKTWWETEDEGNRAIVLSHIMQALGDLGVQEGDDRIFKVVRPLLDDKMSQVRCLAARALSKMGAKGVGVLGDLIEGKIVPASIKGDKGLILCMRKFAMAALGDRRGDAAVTRYVASAAKSQKPDVRAWALRAMQAMGIKNREAAYVANLAHKDNGVAATAALCLGREKKLNAKAIPALARVAAGKHPEDVRDEAARLLARFPSAKAAREISKLADGSDLAALEMVTRYVEPAASKSVRPAPLLAILRDESKKDSHLTVLRILGNAKPRGAVGDLTALYGKKVDGGAHPRVRKRGLIVRALGAIGDKQAVPFLAGLLKGNEEWIRDEATYALGRIGAPAIPALTKLLSDHTRLEHNVPKTFADACRKARGKMKNAWGDPGHPINLPQGLYVSRYAARALGFVGDTKACAALVKCALDEETPKQVSFEAARALALIGEKASMRKVLKPMSPWMRARVADSDDLGGLLAVMDLQPHRKSG